MERHEQLTIEQEILEEIHRPGSTLASIAVKYRLGLRHMDSVNWTLVNGELLDYYKPSGLNRIKRLAWKSVAGQG